VVGAQGGVAGLTIRVILSALASDRPGLTKALADAIHAAGGNWLESHLSRLGGKYVGSVLVDLDHAALPELEAQVRAVDGVGLTVSLVPAEETGTPGGQSLTIELLGQDRPGIIREVTAVLAALGVNIDSLDTGLQAGAWSGESLFRAEIAATLPEHVAPTEVQDALEALSGELMVDFTFAQAE